MILSTNKISLPEEYAEKISPLFKACIVTDGQLGASVNQYLPLNSSLWPGGTPLHIVIENESGDEEMVDLLLENGADISAIDAQGRTPIHVASKTNFQLTSRLLDKYSKLGVNLPNKDGLSLFRTACAVGSTEVSKFLCLERYRVDTNDAVSKDSTIYPGFTLLHIAVRHGAVDVIKKLLQHNADLGLKLINENILTMVINFPIAMMLLSNVMILKKAQNKLHFFRQPGIQPPALFSGASHCCTSRCYVSTAKSSAYY